jgi:hypothetical protein
MNSGCFLCKSNFFVKGNNFLGPEQEDRKGREVRDWLRGTISGKRGQDKSLRRRMPCGLGISPMGSKWVHMVKNVG